MPVILGEHVTLEAGTGAVHTAPGAWPGGLRRRAALRARRSLNPVGSDGRFLPGTPLVAGLKVDEAQPRIIATLRAPVADCCTRSRSVHSYPHCWRHKHPVIFRATPQWFISMDQRGSARAYAARHPAACSWTPAWGEQRINGMIENRPDWCISRQRTWGVPIPLFVHKVSGELHPRTAGADRGGGGTRVEQGGIDAWFALDPARAARRGRRALRQGHGRHGRVGRLGLSFDCVAATRPEIAAPVDLYLEGSDQHRGWFHSSLLMSEALYERAPYRGVLTHGFTVDEKGRKMSKSLGNVHRAAEGREHASARMCCGCGSRPPTTPTR